MFCLITSLSATQKILYLVSDGSANTLNSASLNATANAWKIPLFTKQIITKSSGIVDCKKSVDITGENSCALPVTINSLTKSFLFLSGSTYNPFFFLLYFCYFSY